MSFEIDPKFKHIEVDFGRKINQLGVLSGKMVKSIKPTGEIIVGDKEKMELAWNEGLPIRLDEMDFFYNNANGKQFGPNEYKSSFYLNKVIDVDDYRNGILILLNKLLQKKRQDLQFNSCQIKLYKDYSPKYNVSINGGYKGGFTLEDDATIFDNNVINQLFLLDYMDLNPDSILIHSFENDHKKQISASYTEYFGSLGCDK